MCRNCRPDARRGPRRPVPLDSAGVGGARLAAAEPEPTEGSMRRTARRHARPAILLLVAACQRSAAAAVGRRDAAGAGWAIEGELLTPAAQSRKLRLALICSQAQTTSASRASSSRRPPFMSGCRSLTSALYCWRISDLDWLSWASRISSARRSVGGSRRCARRPRALARVQRRLVAEQLHRVVEAEALPGAALGVRLGAAALRRLAERPRRPAPDPVGGELPLQVVVGVAVEEVPLQIVLAHVVEAEPVEIVEVVRGLRRAELAGLVQPGRSQARSEVSTAPENPRPRARRFLSAVTEMSKSKGERRLIGRPVLGLLARLGRLSLDICRGGPRPVAARRAR